MKNNIFIISGPSGSGEDSVIKGLRKIMPIEKIITATTREKRPGEKEGVDYYFIDKKTFKEKIKKNEFYEWTEEDNGNLYGGTFREIERVKKSKKTVIWKIEYKGVISAKKIIPEAISIFIYIPMNKIKKRLIARNCHSEDFIKSRLDYAKGWFENENIFNYKIENKEGKLDETVKKVADIIKKEINIDKK
jgi:guanylate kinase